MSGVDRYLETISKVRQQRIRHFIDLIEFAVPGLPKRVWDYGGGVIGYGHNYYRYASAREDEFFMIGAGNRKWYVVLYSNAADGKQYLTESFRDRLPGYKIGKSCIDVADKITVADDVLVDLTRQSVAYFRSEFEKPRAPKTLQLWE